MWWVWKGTLLILLPCLALECVHLQKSCSHEVYKRYAPGNNFTEIVLNMITHVASISEELKNHCRLKFSWRWKLGQTPKMANLYWFISRGRTSMRTLWRILRRRSTSRRRNQSCYSGGENNVYFEACFKISERN